LSSVGSREYFGILRGWLRGEKQRAA
jgi:hypothetical protein